MLVARHGTYTADATARAGARHAFGSGGILAQVSPEAILNADPDILLFGGSERDLKELIARPGFNEMRAVREGRAHAIQRTQFLIPGPRTIDGIESLAAVLHSANRRDRGSACWACSPRRSCWPPVPDTIGRRPPICGAR